ncbi:unnamed protein product [Plutella xylostella]|uniref:(diamondback moth) hypothetical protein n=1 Tax=Plutella xylostella TaxID=51655 RepID=A0A8S4G2F6_PLUXY|nr:unnamed protein product [Plutella xylostella]
MENYDKMYCRLCAECKGPDKLLDLDKDREKCVEINKKLEHLNAVSVNVSNHDMLPKTVCYVCWDSLNKATEFLDRLLKAQSILSKLFPRKESSKQDNSDEDVTHTFDDIFSPQPHNDDEEVKIKEENIPLIKLKAYNEAINAVNHANMSTTLSNTTSVKLEPKEESSDSPDSSEDAPQDSTDPYGLNVQALLDAAMGDIPFTPNITLYAKELKVRSKKSIKKWKDYPWVCLHCNHEFPDVQILRVHCREVHNKCATFTCVHCEMSKCYDYDSFVNHVRIHKKSLRNLCQYCDIKTENLEQHLETHFNKSQRACPECGEILRNDVALLKHTREFNCVKIRKPRRKRGTPITEADLTCKLCHKVYKNLNSLRDHHKLHTQERKRNYTCDRCGKTFFNKGTLTTHIMSHDKIRPHVCKICNRSFLFPNMLRRHVEMHSGIKPYSCEQCGRCFRLQYQLNAHKIIHTDSLPYICQYCSKAFRFKQILKNHERQHTGAKPYSCQLCNMEFTNWSNYNKHMKRRHNTDTSKKKITPEGVFPVNPLTGQLIQIEDPEGTEAWKNSIMIPGKRGKKKVIKQEVTAKHE